MENIFRLYYCCLLLICVAPLAAQPDSTFIRLFDNKARINTGLKFRDRSAIFSTKTGEEFKLENTGLDYRIGGRYKFLAYTFSIPLSDLGTGTDERESKNFGLGLTLFLRQYLASGRIRMTTGFRSTTADGASVFREDVKLFTGTFYGFHVLNNKRYSLRASFKQRDRQLKSGGSLLLGGLIDRQRLKADSAGILVPFENGEMNLLNRYAQTKFGVGVGYAHTFLIGGRWFFTPFLIAGPEFRFVSYDVREGTRQRSRFHLSGRLRGYAAFGWNGRRTAIGLTSTYIPTLDKTDNLDTRVRDLAVELRLTWRFLYR